MVLVGRTVHPVRFDGLIIAQVEVAQQDLNARMTHQLLQRANVGAVAQHPDRERMAKAVWMDADPDALGEALTDLLERPDRQRVAVHREEEMRVPLYSRLRPA